MTTKYLNANRYNTIKLNTINSIKKYIKKNPVLKNYIDNLTHVLGCLCVITVGGSILIGLVYALSRAINYDDYTLISIVAVFLIFVGPYLKAKYHDTIDLDNDF